MTLIMDASHLDSIPATHRPAFDTWIDEALDGQGFDHTDVHTIRQDLGGYVFSVFERNIVGRHYVVNGRAAERDVLVHCGLPPELGLEPDVALWLAVQ